MEPLAISKFFKNIHTKHIYQLFKLTQLAAITVKNKTVFVVPILQFSNYIMINNTSKH